MIVSSYNKLYIAKQAAAYSAATTAQRDDYGSSTQLVFNCSMVQSINGARI